MREIKVRYTFRHVETGNIEQKIYSLSQLEERNAKDLSPCFSAKHGYELIVREEYTGLKDKNGVEIYEGDIVKPLGEPPLYMEYSTERMAFVFVDKFDPCGTDYYMTNQIHYQDFEVIGNIYENPELLKED